MSQRGRAAPWKTAAGIAALLLGAAASPARALDAASPLRAETILNLLLFVDWPASSTDFFGRSRVLCIDPADPHGQAVKALARRGLRGQPLEVQDIQLGESVKACDALLLDAPLRAALPEAQLHTAALPVLVLSEEPHVPGDGVAIHLIDEGDRLAFEVHLEPLRRAGLQLSSRLLRLARRVGP